MEVETERLLKLIFPSGIPDHWKYNENFNQYIAKIGDFKIDELLKEPNRLSEEKNSVFEQTQELAFLNYKTFIQTAESSRNISRQFNCTETKLDSLLEKIPVFESQCEEFVQTTSDINSHRRLNSLTLTRNAQLLEILELPQLMDSFIADGLYEDALELVAYVRRLGLRHPDIPIFKSIVKDVERSWLLMLHQLLVQLRQDLQLPRCLQIVGHLRRMEVFTEAELRLKFLQARDVWLQSCLKSIPNDDATQHLGKTIELTRIHLFNIITQFRAIFNDDEHSATVKDQYVNENNIFPSWIQEKISQFLCTLEHDLSRGVTSLDSAIGQCMYFGLSLSRVGCDFRGLMVPIFTHAIVTGFERTVHELTANFERNMEKFTLINKHHTGIPWKSKSQDPIQPPDTLLEFYPLAEYLNGVLTLFNEVRLCAPIVMVTNVTAALQESLVSVAKAILMLYGQEQQAFTANSKDTFTRLCMSFADDLVPYMQKCINILFPPNMIAAHLGIGLQALQHEGIGLISRQSIIEPIKHLLPTAKVAADAHQAPNSKSDSDGDDTKVAPPAPAPAQAQDAPAVKVDKAAAFEEVVALVDEPSPVAHYCDGLHESQENERLLGEAAQDKAEFDDVVLTTNTSSGD